jgi:glycerol-3-phosphate dehydrogenase
MHASGQKPHEHKCERPAEQTDQMGYTPHVLVLGGGVTGTAVARDLAIRGLEVTLVERDGLTSGATGRMQGLLYSGARYAETDQRIARRCLAENRILSDIAPHCIEDTGGLLVASEDEALESLRSACEECEIPVEQLTGDEAREREPALDESVDQALQVPEKVVDPFHLTVATAKSAIEHGATIRTHTEVTDIHTAGGSVEGVTVEHDPTPTGRKTEEDEENEEASDKDEETDEAVVDQADDADGEAEDDATDNEAPDDSDGDDSDTRTDGGQEPKSRQTSRTHGSPDVPGMPGTLSQQEQSGPSTGVEELEPDYVVNATGPWVDRVAELAGFEFPLKRSRSAMVVTDDQPVDTPVLSRDRSLSVVPYNTHCVLGAVDPVSEDAAAFDGDPDDTGGESAGVDRLLSDAEAVVPDVGDAHVLRSFWGVRSGPPKAGPEGRPFVLFDHADYHDCWGMTSVIGGTLTTHRLVAEKVADQVCGRFGISRECQTDEMELPGRGDPEFLDVVMGQFDLPSRVVERTRDRLAGEALAVLETDEPNPVICEAELVTRAEIQHALDDESGTDVDLTDVRVRTEAAMGACQGGRCGHRIAAELHPDHDHDTIEDALDDLLAERWRGQQHGPWGDRLERAAQNYEFHAGTLSRKYRSDDELDVEGFDDGPDTMGSGPPTARRGMRR